MVRGVFEVGQRWGVGGAVVGVLVGVEMEAGIEVGASLFLANTSSASLIIGESMAISSSSSSASGGVSLTVRLTMIPSASSRSALAFGAVSAASKQRFRSDCATACNGFESAVSASFESSLSADGCSSKSMALPSLAAHT